MQMELRRYMPFLLPFVGVTVMAIIYYISGESRVSSVLHEGANTFFLIYMMIILLSLFFLLNYLKRVPSWQVVLTGGAIGYLAGFLAYLIAVLLMPDGVERLVNSITMSGLSSFMIILWIPAVLYCWLWSIASFLIVNGLLTLLEQKK